MITVCKRKGIWYIGEENKCLATLKTFGGSSLWFSKMLTSEQSSTTEAVPVGLSELRHHSLAHVEDLDGEGGVPGCRSRRSHGAVAVDVLASYPLHFLRNCAKDCADGALFWRLWGTEREREGAVNQTIVPSTKMDAKEEPCSYLRIKTHIQPLRGQILIA